VKIKNYKNRTKKGFTLFELLVTISIIGVLTAVAMVSYGGLNKKTRDSRRMADLEKIRISLEAARQIGNTYPGTLSSMVGVYLDKVPTDPKGSGWTYYYNRASSYVYTLCSHMEDMGSTNVGSCGNDLCGTDRDCNYRVVNP
jgi:prepilin-type N-terminal cleavage/methylation domain-containing protein